jgi:hypothetical protein
MPSSWQRKPREKDQVEEMRGTIEVTRLSQEGGDGLDHVLSFGGHWATLLPDVMKFKSPPPPLPELCPPEFCDSKGRTAIDFSFLAAIRLPTMASPPSQL